MIWNIEHWNSPRDHEAATSWETKANDLLWSLRSDGDATRYGDLAWRKTFDEQVKKTPLSLIIASDDQLFALPLAEKEVEWEIRLSKEGAWDRFSTLSQVAVLEGDEKEVSITRSVFDVLAATEYRAACSTSLHGRR